MGQVASQTLTNLHVIEQATDKLVLRPLICSTNQTLFAKPEKLVRQKFLRRFPNIPV